MNNSNSTCFNIEKYTFLKTHIINYGTNVELHKKLVTDRKTVSKEILFQDKFIEFVEFVENLDSEKIIVIDKNNKISTYFCYIKNGELVFSAHSSRFDTSSDIDARKKDWCDIVTKIVNSK